ncbi:hypothetical protein C0992_002812 [Termitomyces sp. T32_za158]|nr:hypothetical protein C0992_002812 [Termitomyces sp. T32_za158]
MSPDDDIHPAKRVCTHDERRVVIPYERLVANLDETLLQKIEALPSDYLAVIPFGAGAKLFSDNPSLNIQILNFLVSLGIQSAPEDLQLAKARWRAKPKGKSDFQAPWTLILSGFSSELLEYLVWQQTFAVDKLVTFNMFPFDKGLRSWFIMNISGDAVKRGDAAKCQALGTIKSTLWFNTRFRSAVNAALSDSNVPGSTDERTLMATESFELTFIESNDARGNPAPIWQLTGKPLTSNVALHRAVVEAARAPRYWLNTHMMETTQAPGGEEVMEAEAGVVEGPPAGEATRTAPPTEDGQTCPTVDKNPSCPSANGSLPHGSGGERAPPVGGLPEEGAMGTGSGQVRRGQREPDDSWETPSAEGEEQWPTTLGADGVLDPPSSTIVTNREARRWPHPRPPGRSDDPTPEQTAQHPPTVGGKQTADPGGSASPPPPLGAGSTRPGGTPQRARAAGCRLNTKAAMKIASLNIRGFMEAGGRLMKWNHISQLMLQKRIGILAVQETHLTEERREGIKSLFRKRLKILISEDPSNPTGKGGVAFVLN